MYYSDKIEVLKNIFGTYDIQIKNDSLEVSGTSYPIVDDVIVLLPPEQYPASLSSRLKRTACGLSSSSKDFAEDIQFTFGNEWQKFPEIMPEHKEEFKRYFDQLDISSLKNSMVCDLGCGIGRWSYFLANNCRSLILVDFSDAIFAARRNLKEFSNSLFFMGDLKRLPFKDNFADFLFCLGVLHHLPTNALEEVRRLKRCANTLLVYLYYALDNRPLFFRFLLYPVTLMRRVICKIRSAFFRTVFVELTAILVYCPLIGLGKIFNLFGLGHRIPLYEAYNNRSLKRIKQDVYDRFFTRIEQRFSRKEILGLKDTFENVLVSDTIPYWHFLCKTAD